MTSHEQLDFSKPELRHIGVLPIQSTELRNALLISNPIECEAIVRLLVTEAQPRAFAPFPLAYEFARQCLADALNLHPKQIGLTGSARLGFATPQNETSEKNWGRPFGGGSDLDFFVISDQLFQKCLSEVVAVKERKHVPKVAEQVERQRLFERYSATAARLLSPHGTIERGFIDTKHLPIKVKPALENINTVRKAMWILRNAWVKAKLDAGSIPHVESSIRTVESKIRIYKDWDAAVRQISRSLLAAAEKCSV
jgi:hypothetical protein